MSYSVVKIQIGSRKMEIAKILNGIIKNQYFGIFLPKY